MSSDLCQLKMAAKMLQHPLKINRISLIHTIRSYWQTCFLHKCTTSS